MGELIQTIGHLVVSVTLLALILTAIRLLPFTSAVFVALALLQYVLPNMTLIDSAGKPITQFTLAFFLFTTLFAVFFDGCSIRKRASHFFDIPDTAFGKD